MKITILEFKVTERYVLRDTWFSKVRKWFSGTTEPDQYHFDVVMKVADPLPNCRPLRENDFIQIENGVKLQVWSVDRWNIVKAKTYMFVLDDLRKSRPKEAFLIYPRTHGHINDRPHGN